MAIIFLNQSECALCGDILRDSSDLQMFPPLTNNMKDPLFIFSDAGVHASCLDKHSLKEEVMHYVDLQTDTFMRKTCHVSGEQINDVNDFISTGLLTSNKQEPLHQFNFLQMKKSQLHNWKERALFLETAAAFIAAGKWDGFMGYNGLQICIDVFK
ncbi:hypothetical protein ACTJJ0_33405 [Chitinophaga sp. 22321]|uniref:Uncharacterized protein n=1 Tax=Chitinophaga hostae TaxID=2831022 RepID=A0ABS5J9V2_9BACT|nr:hypothetical protein [Chitinophaga hostae]MBS0031979.1 hypothetical protein [Chitinophaga hostae]